MVIVIVALTSPYSSIREEIKLMSNNFIEVYVNAPLETFEYRDVKGFYAESRSGKIRGFPGIDDPY